MSGSYVTPRVGGEQLMGLLGDTPMLYADCNNPGNIRPKA